MSNQVLFTLAIIVVLTTFTCVLLFLLVYKPWLRARGHALPLSLLSVLAMRLRGDSPNLLVDAWIELHEAGNAATVQELENAYVAHRARVRNSHELAEVMTRKTAG